MPNPSYPPACTRSMASISGPRSGRVLLSWASMNRMMPFLSIRKKVRSIVLPGANPGGAVVSGNSWPRKRDVLENRQGRSDCRTKGQNRREKGEKRNSCRLHRGDGPRGRWKRHGSGMGLSQGPGYAARKNRPDGGKNHAPLCFAAICRSNHQSRGLACLGVVVFGSGLGPGRLHPDCPH